MGKPGNLRVKSIVILKEFTKSFTFYSHNLKSTGKSFGKHKSLCACAWWLMRIYVEDLIHCRIEKTKIKSCLVFLVLLLKSFLHLRINHLKYQMTMVKRYGNHIPFFCISKKGSDIPFPTVRFLKLRSLSTRSLKLQRFGRAKTDKKTAKRTEFWFISSSSGLGVRSMMMMSLWGHKYNPKPMKKNRQSPASFNQILRTAASQSAGQASSSSDPLTACSPPSLSSSPRHLHWSISKGDLLSGSTASQPAELHTQDTRWRRRRNQFNASFEGMSSLQTDQPTRWEKVKRRRRRRWSDKVINRELGGEQENEDEEEVAGQKRRK